MNFFFPRLSFIRLINNRWLYRFRNVATLHKNLRFHYYRSYHSNNGCSILINSISRNDENIHRATATIENYIRYSIKLSFAIATSRHSIFIRMKIIQYVVTTTRTSKNAKKLDESTKNHLLFRKLKK